jgi:hypothetical protein
MARCWIHSFHEWIQEIIPCKAGAYQLAWAFFACGAVIFPSRADYQSQI